MATHFSVLAGKDPMDRGNWWASVHGVTKSQTRLSIKKIVDLQFNISFGCTAKWFSYTHA